MWKKNFHFYSIMDSASSRSRIPFHLMEDACMGHESSHSGVKESNQSLYGEDTFWCMKRKAFLHFPAADGKQKKVYNLHNFILLGPHVQR
jgi:hypothetical protein